MENNNRANLAFITLGVLALLAAALWGLLAGLQTVFPDFMKDILAFNRMRPLHVSTAVGWIILTATGGVYYYLQNHLDLKIFSPKLRATHLFVFIGCILGIYASYFIGKMGGREYLAFLPVITIPVVFAWILFGVNYFNTVHRKIKAWPVYLWMWGTGIVFMVFHLTEAHLYFLPYFRERFVLDLTVQWKSYGSFVGSWNMLVYGTAIFLMSRMSKDGDSIARGKTSFFFYFLGLANLMFGWAHHTYFVPNASWIRFSAYLISMTEWVVLFKIIWDWKSTLPLALKERKNKSIKFLMSTEFWIGYNVFWALLMSIPSFQLITHGTHVTVAHAMGTTIGINTSILLASVLFIVNGVSQSPTESGQKSILSGFWVFNISLFLFLTALHVSGFIAGLAAEDVFFAEIQNRIRPYMMVFLSAGVGLIAGLFMITLPLLKKLLAKLKNVEV